MGVARRSFAAVAGAHQARSAALLRAGVALHSAAPCRAAAHHDPHARWHQEGAFPSEALAAEPWASPRFHAGCGASKRLPDPRSLRPGADRVGRNRPGILSHSGAFIGFRVGLRGLRGSWYEEVDHATLLRAREFETCAGGLLGRRAVRQPAPSAPHVSIVSRYTERFRMAVIST